MGYGGLLTGDDMVRTFLGVVLVVAVVLVVVVVGCRSFSPCIHAACVKSDCVVLTGSGIHACTANCLRLRALCICLRAYVMRVFIGCIIIIF